MKKPIIYEYLWEGEIVSSADPEHHQRMATYRANYIICECTHAKIIHTCKGCSVCNCKIAQENVK